MHNDSRIAQPWSLPIHRSLTPQVCHRGEICRRKYLRKVVTRGGSVREANQERMLAYGEWLDDNVLAPVPHRQSTTRATNSTWSNISVRRSANGPVFNPRAARAEAASAEAQRCYRISYP